MSEVEAIEDYKIEKVKKLLDLLEEGQVMEADELLDDLARERETSLFQELGKLTRQLRDTFKNFEVDSKITSYASVAMPDAKERLMYVIEKTEESANKTLTAVEDSIPLADEMGKRAQQLNESWERFRQRDMSVDEFRKLSKELGEYLSWTSENVELMQSNLSQILLAQDFQDLTGQVIRKVIGLVQEIQDSLVEMIKISSGVAVDRATVEMSTPKDAEKEKEENNKGCGPVVPGVDNVDAVTSQDDVDELLSSLGF